MPRKRIPTPDQRLRPRPGLDHAAQRRDAVATVHVTCSHSRYALGEIVVQTTYRLRDDRTETDRPHRIYLNLQPTPVIRALWEVIFEEAFQAQLYQAQAITIHLAPETVPPPWDQRVYTLVEIVAAELRVVVRGTAMWKSQQP